MNWMMIETVCKAICVATLSVLLATAAEAPKCERFQALTPEEKTGVLASNDRRDEECTAFLILSLGDEVYLPASSAIVNYLDFEWPKQRSRRSTVFRQPWLGDRFPAVSALFAFDQSAVPAITEFLAGANRPPLAQANASESLLLIYSRNPEEAVRALIRASHAATDVSASARLRTAAFDAAARCQTWGPAAGPCREALLQQIRP